MTSPSLARLLFDHPAPPQDVLVYDDHGELTGFAMRAAVTDLATKLRNLGVREGVAVASQFPNGADAVVSMMAIWQAGAVFVPVNHRSPDSERRRILDALAVAAIVDPSGPRAVEGTPREFEQGIAFVTWTSGTTGPPKAILHTHEGYLELLDRVLGSLNSGKAPSPHAGPPNLIPVPLALNSGIYNALFGLRTGRSLVVMDGFGTARFAELVRRFEITSTVLPPAAIAMLTHDQALTGLAPLKYVRSITAPLSPAVAKAFYDRFGVFVLNGYGQAEVGEVIGWTARDARANPDKVGAAGRPHAGVGIKIVDPNGRSLPVGEDGQLLVRPPKMAVGYATGEDLGERFDSDGYLATGDLARVDEQGFVWITGRLGDVIVRGGNKVHPSEVEDVLRSMPAVEDAAVVAVPDERLGEMPVACLVDAPGVPPATNAELTDFCRERLVAYKVPAAFHRFAELPRNEIGKILRSQLRDELIGLDR